MTRSVRGRIFSVVSDSGWKSTDNPSEGWQAANFDDSTWARAYAPYPNKITPARIIAGTKAESIWHYQSPVRPDGESGPDEAWFRKAFTLPVAPDAVISAKVTASADDDFDLYLNGDLVISDRDGVSWTGPFTADISSRLTNGNNVFAVHASDAFGKHEWMLLDATIEYKEQTTKPASPHKD